MDPPKLCQNNKLLNICNINHNNRRWGIKILHLFVKIFYTLFIWAAAYSRNQGDGNFIQQIFLRMIEVGHT